MAATVNMRIYTLSRLAREKSQISKYPSTHSLQISVKIRMIFNVVDPTKQYYGMGISGRPFLVSLLNRGSTEFKQ